MIQVSQADIQRSIEHTLDVGRQQPDVYEALLKTSSLDVLRSLNDKRMLNPEQRQVLDTLEHGMQDVSKALMLTLHSCLGSGETPANFDNVSFDPNVAARRLASYDKDTLHKLADCVFGGHRSKEDLNNLKAAMISDGPVKDAALLTLAETLLTSANDSTALIAVAGILALDPQNESIRIIFQKAMEYLRQLRLLATGLLRSFVWESRSEDSPSFMDTLVAKHSPTPAPETAGRDVRGSEMEMEHQKVMAEAAARVVQATATLRRAQQLRDDLKKLNDEIVHDYAQSLSGPADQQFENRIRYNQEVALQDKDRAELKDLEAEIPA